MITVKWTEQDEKLFQQFVHEGLTLRQIAPKLGRSAKALERKRYRAAATLTTDEYDVVNILGSYEPSHFTIKDLAADLDMTTKRTRSLMNSVMKKLFLANDTALINYARRSVAAVI